MAATRVQPVDASGAQGYGGDLSPREAWDMLAADPASVLVDCRSQPEWSFVGLPDLSAIGKKPVLVEWQTWPGMKPNPSFVDQVRASGVGPDTTVIFLCRSGGRSRSAAIAMTGSGFKRCYNLSGGFEGDRDRNRHRGHAGGWKVAGLPWFQE